MQRQTEEPLSPWKVAVNALTTTYRHETLTALCQGQNTSLVGWEMSQHLLDQRWKDMTPVVEKSSLIVYICPGCGATIHPGFHSTTLRVSRFSTIKAEKTRRRRNLRKKQKRTRIALQMQSKDMNRSNVPTKANDDGLKMEYVLLRDSPDLFFDRHHLLLQCSRCVHKIRLKGLKQEVPSTKQSIQRVHAISTKKNNTNNNNRKGTKKEKDEVSGGVEDGVSGEVDFLTLPPRPPLSSSTTTAKASRVPTLMTTTMLTRVPPKRLISTLDNNSKKKKKGKQPQNQSKLMNFLSSLND